jgi:protein-L-isoaspartate(D-aspartate) O-methyltransferase
VHVGAGTGYYTALLAELSGPEGSVRAYEIVPELAGRARDNLRNYPQVAVDGCSGSEGKLPHADVIYVSAGATEPMANWLDALRPGGRLLFPLTPEVGMGAMLLVTRQVGDVYSARFISAARFIPCMGARDVETGVRLAAAFQRGGEDKVKSLRRSAKPDVNTCWCFGNDWWLSYELNDQAGDRERPLRS